MFERWETKKRRNPVFISYIYYPFKKKKKEKGIDLIDQFLFFFADGSKANQCKLMLQSAI